jgi:anthranilate phosphoribosyltransferase
MQASDILQAIRNEEPTLDFLKSTQHGVSPQILSEVVRELRKDAVVPEGLLNTLYQAKRVPLLDVCGTGGSTGHRLNTSTLVALLAPDLGYSIIKHGGRSASGKVGSLDLLERLGFDLKFLFNNAAEIFRATGLGYLGAAFTYTFFGRYTPLRKSLGHPTIFNLLGPLLNPTLPSLRLLGAYNSTVAEMLALTMGRLGEDGFVVTSNDDEGDLDEGSPWGITEVRFVRKGQVSILKIPPLLRGGKNRKALFADGAQAALEMLGGVLSDAGNAARELVAYNLALVTFIEAEFPEDATQFLANFQIRFQQILTSFSHRLTKANRRIERIRQLSPVHSHTPTSQSLAHLNIQTSNFTRAAESRFSPLSNQSGTPGWLFAEVKVRTPLRVFPQSMSLHERVTAYAAADAVSVVTHPSFGGNLELLRAVRASTSKPVLAKDFVREPQHVKALAASGADGILLLADMVSSETLTTLVKACLELNVTPFVESSWRIPEVGIPVFNSRNLFSLEEGKNYRDSVASFSPKTSPNCVFASSLSLPLEMRLAKKAARGIIVGSELMKLSTPSAIASYISEFQTSRPIFKACGARSIEDIEVALQGGADLVGINLISTSRRCVTALQLHKMLPQIQQNSGKIVLLTSHATPCELLTLVSELEVYEQCYGAPIIPNRRGVLSTGQQVFLGTVAHILDGMQPGSGKIEPYSKNLSFGRVPVLVAGGVSEQNVTTRLAEASQAGYCVAGIDTASGIENETGTGFSLARIEFISAKLAIEATK